MTRKDRIQGFHPLVCLLLTALLSAASLGAAEQAASTRKLRSMARVFMTVGNYDKARGLAEKAYTLSQTTDVGTNEKALCMIDLGTVYSNLNLLSKADAMLRGGADLQQQALFATHPYVAHTYRMLSDVQRRSGDLAAAEQTLARAVGIMLEHCSLESSEMSPFILESAKLDTARGDFQRAETNYQTALDMIEQTYGKQHAMTAGVLESMAQCSLMQQQFDRADAYISSALAIQSSLFGRHNPVLVDTWLTKARICRAQGQHDRSEYYLSKATASVENSRNAITLARVYEQVNQVRHEKRYAAAVHLN